jgi:hypothetical protein
VLLTGTDFSKEKEEHEDCDSDSGSYRPRNNCLMVPRSGLVDCYNQCIAASPEQKSRYRGYDGGYCDFSSLSHQSAV